MIDFKNVRITYEDYVLSPDQQIENINDQESSRIVLGEDLAMLGTGDLFIQSGDLQSVSGIVNFAQAITHRLMTQLGTHPEDPSIGVPWDDFLGRVYISKQVTLIELRQAILDSLFQDGRVLDVQVDKLNFLDPNVIEIELQIRPNFDSKYLTLGFLASR